MDRFRRRRRRNTGSNEELLETNALGDDVPAPEEEVPEAEVPVDWTPALNAQIRLPKIGLVREPISQRPELTNFGQRTVLAFRVDISDEFTGAELKTVEMRAVQFDGFVAQNERV